MKHFFWASAFFLIINAGFILSGAVDELLIEEENPYGE
jgi:hypothetical protein